MHGRQNNLPAGSLQVQAEQQRVGVVAAQRRSAKAQVAEQRRKMGGTDAAVKQEQAVSGTLLCLLCCRGGPGESAQSLTYEESLHHCIIDVGQGRTPPQSRLASSIGRLGIAL